MILIINKINENFKKTTGSSYANGLSVCVDMIKSVNDKIKIADVVGYLEVYRFIQYYKPKVVIFEAMSFSYQTILEFKRSHEHINFFVHLHSKFPFLAQEHASAMYIDEMFNGGVGVIFNSREMLAAYPKGIYLPNYYSLKFISAKKISADRKQAELHVGCHGSLRHLKNTVNQALGAIRAANDLNRKLHFHINSTRDDGEKKVIYNTLSFLLKGHNGILVDCQWMNHLAFLKYCSTLDVGLQVSLNETFNIVAADYVTAGIPLVVSPEIDWVSKDSQSMCDPYSICESIKKVLGRQDFIDNNKICLQNHNAKAVDDWNAFVDHYS